MRRQNRRLQWLLHILISSASVPHQLEAAKLNFKASVSSNVFCVGYSFNADISWNRILQSNPLQWHELALFQQLVLLSHASQLLIDSD